MNLFTEINAILNAHLDNGSGMTELVGKLVKFAIQKNPGAIAPMMDILSLPAVSYTDGVKRVELDETIEKISSIISSYVPNISQEQSFETAKVM